MSAGCLQQTVGLGNKASGLPDSFAPVTASRQITERIGAKLLNKTAPNY